MSGSLTPTVASAPTATQAATNLLGLMAALNGQPTDYNPGSQIRSFSEADGLVIEQQGVSSQALALQALAYGAMSLFGISQSLGQAATGTVTFATSLPVSSAPISTLGIGIPSGTLMQTAGGVQFATVTATVLPSGAASITVGVVATTSGTIGNVGSGSITGSPLTPVGYPLFVTNAAPTGGGANPGTQSLAFAQFAAKAASLGLCSPVAVANAAIGVIATGTGEIVQKSACVEPWVLAGSGAGSGTAGFTLYIDNGTGGASASLLAAVQAWISGDVATNLSGYRPAGVPYKVSGVTALYANVGVTGVLLPGLFNASNVANAIITNVQGYFNDLNIAPDAAYQPQVAARAADSGLGAFSALTVNLYYATSPSTPVAFVSGGTGVRVILQSIVADITVGN